MACWQFFLASTGLFVFQILLLRSSSEKISELRVLFFKSPNNVSSEITDAIEKFHLTYEFKTVNDIKILLLNTSNVDKVSAYSEIGIKYIAWLITGAVTYIWYTLVGTRNRYNYNYEETNESLFKKCVIFMKNKIMKNSDQTTVNTSPPSSTNANPKDALSIITDQKKGRQITEYFLNIVCNYNTELKSLENVKLKDDTVSNFAKSVTPKKKSAFALLGESHKTHFEEICFAIVMQFSNQTSVECSEIAALLLVYRVSFFKIVRINPSMEAELKEFPDGESSEILERLIKRYLLEFHDHKTNLCGLSGIEEGRLFTGAALFTIFGFFYCISSAWLILQNFKL